MPGKINLLLIAVDSLRADHMSCYGYGRLTTPHVDRLAKSGVLFERAYSPYIPTTPAYTTMLSGMDVFSHQVVSLAPQGPLDEGIKLLPEILAANGYRSACVGFDGGFYRGFDRYETYEAWMAWEDGPGHKAEEANSKVLPLLDSMAKHPFFLFVRHMDPHAPYLPPQPFNTMFYSRDPCDPSVNTMKPALDCKPFREFFQSWMPPGITDAEWAVAQYDSSLAYMDCCITAIVTRLEELGLLERTLIVITSDHGETLTEHGIYFDHHGLYEPTIHIPLIYHLPGVIAEGRRVGGFVLPQDLPPTVLSLMGYPRLARRLGMDGRDVLLGLDAGRANGCSQFYLTECTWMRKRGWRTPHYKLIESLEPDIHGKPPVELYDLVDDPLEDNNLAGERPEVVEGMTAAMRRWVVARVGQTGNHDPIAHSRPSFLISKSVLRALKPRKKGEPPKAD